MPRSKQARPFKFQPYSAKQLKVLYWWVPGSPYADWAGIIADGSIRSGKTISFIDSFIDWSISSFVGENFIISSKTIGALKRNVANPMLGILSAKGIKYKYIASGSEPHIAFCGNKYFLFGASTEASQDALQGLTAAGWLGDEVALHPQNFIEQAIGRCSVDGRKFWLNCNPESPYHYVKKGIIDRAVEKKFLRLHFTMTDNLSLSSKIVEGYERLYSGIFYKRMVLGLWVAAEGAIYDMFGEESHVVEYAEIPPMERFALGLDWGQDHPTAACLIGYNGDREVYQIDEFGYSKGDKARSKTVSEIVQMISDWLSSLGFTSIDVYVDPSALVLKTELQAHNEEGTNEVCEFRVLSAKNEVAPGINTVSNLLNRRQLKIASHCVKTIKEMTTYVWCPKAQARGKDEPIKVDDDFVDGGRYVLHTLFGARAKITKVIR